MKTMMSRPKGRRGFLIIEVLVAVFVLSVGAAAMYSIYPVINRSKRMAKDESVAVQMVTRLIEHVQMLGAADLTRENLRALNLIDASPTSQPYSFSRIPLDEASRYSPAQALSGAVAQMTITDVGTNSKLVSITLAWNSSSGSRQTITTGTIVGGYR